MAMIDAADFILAFLFHHGHCTIPTVVCNRPHRPSIYQHQPKHALALQSPQAPCSTHASTRGTDPTLLAPPPASRTTDEARAQPSGLPPPPTSPTTPTAQAPSTRQSRPDKEAHFVRRWCLIKRSLSCLPMQ
ncbi:hypothetical protein LIA77_03920 [Sarocladium implicatum]|nr:hypothetical protein LIA77_03920 [Sarocladium implicatum]